jgi:hypothetical protein
MIRMWMRSESIQQRVGLLDDSRGGGGVLGQDGR